MGWVWHQEPSSTQPRKIASLPGFAICPHNGDTFLPGQNFSLDWPLRPPGVTVKYLTNDTVHSRGRVPIATTRHDQSHPTVTASGAHSAFGDFSSVPKEIVFPLGSRCAPWSNGHMETGVGAQDCGELGVCGPVSTRSPNPDGAPGFYRPRQQGTLRGLGVPAKPMVPGVSIF